MCKSYRMGVVLLSAIVAMTLNSQFVFGQQIKFGGGSNQSNNDKKDKDKDDDDHKNDHKNKDKDNDKHNQSNQNSQNNQGSNKSSKSDNTFKSDKSNGPVQVQPFIQGNQNKNGQGDSNKPGGKNSPGFPNQPFQQQQQFQKFKDDDDHDHNKSNFKFGGWKGDQWQGSHKADNWTKVYGNKQQMFTSDWYKEHPRAWKYDNHKSNVWVVATVPGMYSWLGWGNAPQQYLTGYNGPRFDPSLYGDWYPLGVYSLMTGQDDMGTRVLQLAVDRHGRIAGNYFDMITDSDHSVSGQVDQQSQHAEWTLNQNNNIRFRANITRLLQPYGNVTVLLPGGEQRWQFVRLEN